MKLEPITVKIDTTQIQPILEKLYGRLTELQKENDELREKITDLEGLPLHS